MVLRFGLRRRPGMLDLYDKQQGDLMLAALRAQSARSTKEISQVETTDEWNFRIWTDGELAAFIARGTKSGNAKLAEAEMRRRESWQTPARWSLVVSCFALLVSFVALLVSVLT